MVARFVCRGSCSSATSDRLAANYNPIVLEGAGSISEINLRDTDLVNLPMAQHAKADVILVGDIDRGGVFASVYGSIALQSPEDRQRIKGIIINKFRGDLRLFEKGRRMLEDICEVPVLGVVPYYKDIHIEEEDSVSLEQKRRQLAEGKVNVAVVLLRHISNFTDFDTLERDPRVNLFYTNNTSDLHDPDGLEGSITRLPGLGLLPIHTTITTEKTTKQVTFQFDGQTCLGYEIHQGVSDTDEPILFGDHCIGTYIHGFLDNPAVINRLLSDYVDTDQVEISDPQTFKEEQYDKLAAHVRQHVDMERLYQILTDD